MLRTPYTKRYSLPNENGQGWVIAFLDHTGCFTALSDWGNVAYRWNERGLPEGVDFRRFLLQCEDSYLLSKLGQNRKEYDPEKTLASVRDLIITLRRDSDLSKDKARDEWELLIRDCHQLETEFDFQDWMTNTKLSDAGELYCTRYVGEVTAFVKHAMPRLRKLIEKELEADAQVTALEVAKCCGCSCGKCSHRGGDDHHTDACKERFSQVMEAAP